MNWSKMKRTISIRGYPLDQTKEAVQMILYQADTFCETSLWLRAQPEMSVYADYNRQPIYATGQSQEIQRRQRCRMTQNFRDC